MKQNKLFTIGDEKIYIESGTRKRRSTNYQNVQLEPETYYSVFQRTFKSTVSGKLFQSKHESNLRKCLGLRYMILTFAPVLTESVSGIGGFH